MSARRVAITGLGVIAPLGNSMDELMISLMAGRSGALTRRSFALAPSGQKTHHQTRGGGNSYGLPRLIANVAVSRTHRVLRIALDVIRSIH
jgi:3-oxoacyl-(acyl-carrier-protein) synthase